MAPISPTEGAELKKGKEKGKQKKKTKKKMEMRKSIEKWKVRENTGPQQRTALLEKCIPTQIIRKAQAYPKDEKAS